MFGISIYPYKEQLDETKAYIRRAAELGYGRVFTNLLALPDDGKDEILSKMREAIACAREQGMEVVLDVNPGVFKQLGVAETDLSFFKEMGATGVRLDSSFDGLVESLLTFDASGLDLEVNISNDTEYVANVLSYQPNRSRVIGCHNFYPQRFTGLDYDYFMKCSAKYKKLGLRTAAFVNAPSADHGPHAFADGLCTLEEHRDLPIQVQGKHLIATGLIDDVIIANAFASDEELVALSKVRQDQIELAVAFAPGATETEREIVLGKQHFNRGDINSYSIRSTFVKLDYRDASIPANNTAPDLHLGDITIGNDSFGQYKAELNIVKREMPNTDGHKNVVAHIVDQEKFLMRYIEPWTKFRFVEA